MKVHDTGGGLKKVTGNSCFFQFIVRFFGSFMMFKHTGIQSLLKDDRMLSFSFDSSYVVNSKL